jgi:flagellar protein FlbD
VVILVHRLRGEPLFVNADLIETIESTPDTALVLVDGRRILVDEDARVVVERVVAFRASLLVAADQQRAQVPGLHVVPDEG